MQTILSLAKTLEAALASHGKGSTSETVVPEQPAQPANAAGRLPGPRRPVEQQPSEETSQNAAQHAANDDAALSGAQAAAKDAAKKAAAEVAEKVQQEADPSQQPAGIFTVLEKISADLNKRAEEKKKAAERAEAAEQQAKMAKEAEAKETAEQLAKIAKEAQAKEAAEQQDKMATCDRSEESLVNTAGETDPAGGPSCSTVESATVAAAACPAKPNRKAGLHQRQLHAAQTILALEREINQGRSDGDHQHQEEVGTIASGRVKDHEQDDQGSAAVSGTDLEEEWQTPRRTARVPCSSQASSGFVEHHNDFQALSDDSQHAVEEKQEQQEQQEAAAAPAAAPMASPAASPAGPVKAAESAKVRAAKENHQKVKWKDLPIACKARVAMAGDLALAAALAATAKEEIIIARQGPASAATAKNNPLEFPSTARGGTADHHYIRDAQQQVEAKSKETKKCKWKPACDWRPAPTQLAQGTMGNRRPCKWFQDGTCRHGANCWFHHAAHGQHEQNDKKETLVTEVKQRQRSCDYVNVEWQTFCKHKGTSRLDPWYHSTVDLQAFLTAVDAKGHKAPLGLRHEDGATGMPPDLFSRGSNRGATMQNCT